MKIAYVTNCFGTQSHTFIRREIEALRRLGLVIHLYGIRKDSIPAPESMAIVNETHYLYPLRLPETILAILYYIFTSPLNFFRGLYKAGTSKEFSIRRRCKMVYHYLLAAQTARRLKKQQITHIHAHFKNVSASIAMYASHHSGIPFSITVHSAGTYKTPHILGLHQKLRQARFLVMISNYNIDYYDAIEPCRAKSHVVRCGIELDQFSFRAPRPLTQPLQILAVGRFVQKKGFAHLLDAISTLSDENINLHLTLIGDGPLMPELKAKAADSGIESVITFAGQQNTDHVRQAMTRADVVVVPSVTSDSGEMEGLPVVIMEAMASGVPVIASDHSAISEIVKDRETGLLTQEKDAQGIARAIKSLELLDLDRMTKSAHQFLKENFDIEIVARKRAELFSRYTSGI